MNKNTDRRKEPGQKIVKDFGAWCKRNDLSPRQVSAMLASAGQSVSRRTIEAWLQNKSIPGLYAAKAVEELMSAHPTVTDAPQFGRWPEPLPDKKVDELRKLRKQGLTLLAIAQRLGVSESTVSRIARGQRRAK